MQLKLRHNTTNTEYLFNIIDKKESKMFYTCEIVLDEGMQDGEYAYELYEVDGEFLASGLLQIGEYVQNPKNEYNGEKKKVIVYGK
jgi:hypothetical protein